MENKKMRIAMIYTVYNGDDLDMLVDSINQHKGLVDRIFVCFQRISNTGVDSGISDLEVEYFIRENFLMDNICILHFTPNLKLSTKDNERLKHDLMLQKVKSFGYTHFILSALDHFYEPEELKWAIEFHKINPQVDLSVTKMITYYNSKDWALFPLENYYMPFIHKIYENTTFSKTAKYPVLVDPSVKVNTSGNVHIFKENEVIMHHYSMVRKNIKNKFKNAAASIRWGKEQVQKFIFEYENAKIGDKITYFKSLQITDKQEVLNFIKKNK